MLLVTALGGNALLRRGEPLTPDNQRAHIRIAARALAPIAARVETKTPAGITRLRVATLTATLADVSNPLSLTQLVRTTTLNGEVSTSTYTAANRTTVSTSAEGRTLTTRLDALGRIVFRQVSGLDGTSMAYDARGRIASQA